MEAEIINLVERILWNFNPKADLVTTGMYNKLYSLEMEQIKTDLKDIQWLVSQPSAEADYYTDCLKKLKEILYEADDLFDEISTDGLQQQAMILTRSTPAGRRISKEVSRLFFPSSSSSSSSSSYARSSYTHKIKRTREHLHDVLAQLLGVDIDRDRDRGDLREPRPEVLFSGSEPEEFKERDYKKEIKELLLDNIDTKDNVSVVAILGGLGSGKTELARDIFNDDEIDKKFDLRAWVRVSENFDVALGILDILSSISRRPLPSFGSKYDALGKELAGKRYLIVLDDVHSKFTIEWQRLKYHFNRGKVGSRIIVTTRDESVADEMGAFKYHLLGLTEEDALKLFDQIAGPTTLRKDLLDAIVRKCSGVPLVIKMIATMLHDQNTQNALTDEDLKRILQSQDVIRELKNMCYDKLAPPLKVCFMYCALFPKDTIIDIENLIHLWIAQGFIVPPSDGDSDSDSDGKMSLEDLGMEYFKALLRRSFIEEVGKDEVGNMKYCKLRSLVHDMANEIAGKGIAFLDTNKDYDEKSLEMARHLCFMYDLNSSKKIYGTRLRGKKKFRSFFVRERYNRKSSLVGTGKRSNHVFNLSDFKRLRVCDVHNFGIDKVSPSIRELKYLRYLDFSGNEKLQFLPNCITELQNLQVLKLSNCEKLKWLPKDISKMVNLRHLDCHGCWELRYMPRGLGKLASLQTLTWFVVATKEERSSSSRASRSGDAGGLDELRSLNELRGKLTILNLKDARHGTKELHQLAGVLKEKQHLQSLTLSWGRIDEDDWNEEDTKIDDDYKLLHYLQPHESLKALKLSRYGGGALPNWLATLKQLVSFTVSMCQRVQRLPAFEPMARLKYLRIEGMDNLQCIETGESSSFFPDLKELRIHKCPVLKGWEHDKRSRSLVFPGLSTLEITDCPMLTSVPTFPYLEGNLVLKSNSAAVLLQTLEMKMADVPSSSSSSSSSSSLRPLCKLQRLRIEGMQEDLTNLLDLMVANLTSLHTLHIYDCPELESLPKRMSETTSLRELGIRNCRKLKEKCEDKKSEEWQKIKHIPNIKIGRRQVQLNGRYLLDSDV